MLKLTLLHTNDLHSRFDNWIKLASILRERRAALLEEGHHVLVLDAGDHLDMSVAECLMTEGRLNVELLNELGFDALGVGNNELSRFSLEQLDQLSRELTIPWLLTNVRQADDSLITHMRSSKMFDMGDGVHVGLIGITDQFGTLYEDSFGMKNVDTVQSVRTEANALRTQGANVLILLSHCGHTQDLELAAALSNEIDVIVGAHSHTILQEPVIVEGVRIIQAGCHGEFLGELTLEIDPTTGTILQHTGYLHSIVPTLFDDPQQSAILAQGREETQRILDEVLLSIEKPLEHDELIRLAADAMSDYYHSEVGLMIGSFASSGLPAGDITVGDIYDVCASLICVAHLEMQGQQLLGLLSETKDPNIYERKVLGYGLRPRGLSIGKLQFSGLTWTEQEGAITNVMVNDEPLDLKRWYKIGSGEHLHIYDCCGYPSLLGTKVLAVDNYLYVKDVLVEYLQKQKAAMIHG